MHIGDRILAVNRVDISTLHHGDIVNLIKDSGYSVVLTVGPPLGMYSKICEVQAKKTHDFTEFGGEIFQCSESKILSLVFLPGILKKILTAFGGNQFCTGILYHNQL